MFYQVKEITDIWGVQIYVDAKGVSENIYDEVFCFVEPFPKPACVYYSVLGEDKSSSITCSSSQSSGK